MALLSSVEFRKRAVRLDSSRLLRIRLNCIGGDRSNDYCWTLDDYFLWVYWTTKFFRPFAHKAMKRQFELATRGLGFTNTRRKNFEQI